VTATAAFARWTPRSRCSKSKYSAPSVSPDTPSAVLTLAVSSSDSNPKMVSRATSSARLASVVIYLRSDLQRALAAPARLYNVVRLQSPKDHKNDSDDQDGAKDTDATVTEAITVPAEVAAESTEQENNEDDDEDSSKRHILSRRAKILERRNNLYFPGRSRLPERRVGAMGSKAASATSSISQARRIGVPALNLRACDRAS
jgi:hypothetical protein